MSNSPFFDDAKEQSVVKATIVAKYFKAWADVILSRIDKENGRLNYIDLFAGPGRYEDGTESTPLLVLERAIKHERLRQSLVTLFNDRDPQNSQSLRDAISELPGIERLKYAPTIHSFEVGERIAEQFEKIRLEPTLFFVDPWGYKGLSLRLVNSIIKDWGCECIFFFNYNRINMGLNNSMVYDHMNSLFGAQRADHLRSKLSSLGAEDRELVIVEEISQALKGQTGRYVLPFRFRNDVGSRTSHHLIFVSKHIRGYEIMKEIMAKESSSSEQGVASFEYNPAGERQPLLFDLSQPIDMLADDLTQRFAGRMISMEQVYSEHHVGKRYIRRNYKDVLRQLEQDGKIRATPPMSQRKPGTFADSVMVQFPQIPG